MPGWHVGSDRGARRTLAGRGLAVRPRLPPRKLPRRAEAAGGGAATSTGAAGLGARSLLSIASRYDLMLRTARLGRMSLTLKLSVRILRNQTVRLHHRTDSQSGGSLSPDAQDLIR